MDINQMPSHPSGSTHAFAPAMPAFPTDAGPMCLSGLPLGYPSAYPGHYSKPMLRFGTNPGGTGSRRQREFTPEDQKDCTYWVKRRRNNEAARRSRQRRRMDECLLEARAVQLLRENERLKATLSAVHGGLPVTETGQTYPPMLYPVIPTVTQPAELCSSSARAFRTPHTRLPPDCGYYSVGPASCFPPHIAQNLAAVATSYGSPHVEGDRQKQSTELQTPVPEKSNAVAPLLPYKLRLKASGYKQHHGNDAEMPCDVTVSRRVQ